jgi:hypothetical protein
MRFEKFCIFVAVTLLFLFILGQRAYSQPQFQRSFEVGITNLLWADLTLVYTQRLKEKTYLEISNSFVYRKATEHDNSSSFSIQTQDPAKMYDLYKLRIGLRHFHTDRFYSSPLIIFNIGGFKDRTIINYIEGNGWDEDYRLSRLRYDLGVIYKFGFLKIGHNGGLKNFYFGVGFKAKFYQDTIFQKWERHYLYFDGPPMHEKYVKFMPTFHLGIMLVNTK